MIKKIKIELIVLFLLLISIFFSHNLDLVFYFYFTDINKSLNLGLLVPSTWIFNKIIKKAKLKFIKFLILEKKFLTTNKLNKVKKNIFYYTVKSKILFNKHKSKNLIFENL